MTEANMPEKLGRYDIVRVLGKGAMGVVYEGKDPNIGRRVAIKTARRDVMEASGMADEMMTRFLREAQAAGTLNHPNIIIIFDADEQDGIAYIAMEYLEGGDLQDLLEKRARMGEKEIVEMGAAICEALAVAHDHGVIHRDIKPANIMVPDNGPIKVADFGIAHVTDSNLTQEGALIGTPHYMSPEQFMGQKVDGRSDLFSVGVILYEMLTGEKPFTGEALSTVMHHVIKSEPVAPSELNFSVSDAVNSVVLRMMSKRPNDRYQDGRAAAAALRECLKPNPDTNILKTGMAAAEATMVTGGGGDATIAGADPDATSLAQQSPEDATMAAATADQAADTMASAPDAADQTVAAATVDQDAETTRQTAREELKPAVSPRIGAGESRKPLSAKLIAGVAGAVLVIIVGVVSVMGGGDGEPFYSRVQPYVYGTSDFGLWADYESGKLTKEDMEGKWEAVTVDIDVYDNDPDLDRPVVGSARDYNAMTSSAIMLEGKPKIIGFKITYKGGEPKYFPHSKAATEQGQLFVNSQKPICLDLSEE